jgi:hypothetical protein
MVSQDNGPSSAAAIHRRPGSRFYAAVPLPREQPLGEFNTLRELPDMLLELRHPLLQFGSMAPFGYPASGFTNRRPVCSH